ncbi:hypothetical protein [Flavonifractor plautii]|jgi:uncharacterized membrane protein YgcG|uniref:hypothetical protein n=1 Tax=Flavonifractor plautii TaxID=292800 RepID=UPI001106E3FA|nr:hypothetical protein [Flavonifractor plautii]DAO10415.1 MAG TPA: hypothetical protein [Caudoviricetes sp.]
MPTFTYDQFQKAAQDSGLMGEFSAADLSLAQRNPDAGMSLLKYKQDYHAATTDEARALANLGAEGIRSSYGNYTGGDNGGSFYLDPLSPSSFDGGKAPTYQNQYAGDIADLWEQQKNYGSYDYGEAAPVYNNRYDDTIQDLIQGILNREDFSYDPATDPLYQNYRKQYTREGQRATADTLGAAAAASGGIPSSYATTAAAQAGNYYAAQMTDKIPELYQLAYNQYLNDYNMQLSDLGVVQGAEQSDYDKYLNELNQFNTDRAFDYNAWLDEYNMTKDQLQTAQGLEQLDYTKYLNELQQFNTDREFNYGQLLDEIDSQTRERQEDIDNALRAAEFGDYSFLQDMGIDTSNNPADFERQYTLALLAAEYGDFSGLEALGITPSAQNLASFNRTASGSTSRSSSGGGSSGGSSGSGSSSTGGSTGTSAASAAMQRANANQGRVTSEADWNALVAAYGEDTLRAAGYTYAGSGGGSSGEDSGYSLSDLNTNSVLQLGIGPISYQTVEQLVEQGKVEAYTDSNGNLSVRWMPGYNANNYRNDRSTAGGLTQAPFLPTP